MRVLVFDELASRDQRPDTTLEIEPGITIVARFASLTEAPAAVKGIDLTLIDQASLECCGLNLLAALFAANPHAGILVMPSVGLPAHMAEAGARQFAQASPRAVEVIGAIRRLTMGDERPHVALQRGRDPQGSTAVAQLTSRERDVLATLAEGLTDRQIAQRLSISSETVRKHMVHILDKLQVRSRVQALVFAVRHGVVTID